MAVEGTALTMRSTCGLLASAARLVPVPLLDDLLREKALHLLVSRTLKAHGRTYASSRVAPLYGDPRGCLHGCLVFLALLPVKLIIYPIRKIITWVMAAKNLARDLSEAILLGRVLDDLLAEGRLADGADAGALRTESERIRVAFDNAIQGTDMQLLRAVLQKALGSVQGLPRAVLRGLRRLRGSSADDGDPTAGLSAEDRATMRAGTDRIASALSTPEMQVWLEAFDARFRENLRVLEARAAG